MCMHVYAARAYMANALSVRSCTERARDASGGGIGMARGGEVWSCLATCPFLTHDIASDFTGRVVIRRKPPLD